MISLLKKVRLPFLALTLALAVSGILVAFSDSRVLALKSHPLSMLGKAITSVAAAYAALFRGAIYDPRLTDSSWVHGFYPLSETLVTASPLILTGLSVTLAFRAGLFNIGAQGQFVMGAIAASYVGFHFNLPIFIHVVAATVAAMVAAGLYGGFVGLLKARTGAHEVIVTIMLNYVASYFLVWLLGTKTFLRPGRLDPLAPPVSDNARLPHLFGDTYRVNFGFLLALAAAWCIWWILNRSTIGFKFRSVGANARASKTAGISVPRTITTVMFIAGALSGLASAVQVLGSEPTLMVGVGGSFGFDAITVALLGRATPIGTVFAALLFGALRAGGLTMQSSTETPLDLVLIIQALVVLFIAAPALVRAAFRLKSLDQEETLASKGWNG